MRAVRSLLCVLFLAVPFCLLAGCDGADDKSVNGDLVNLNFSSGVMFPIPSGSCADKQTALTTGVITNSLKATSLQIPNVTLTWKSTTYLLTIYSMKITLESSAITGGKFTSTLAQSDIEPLFGKASATIPAAASDLAPTVINSSGTKSGYAACGLALGSIPLVNPDTQGPFTALVTVELLGSAHDVTFTDQKTVKKSFTTSANYN